MAEVEMVMEILGAAVRVEGTVEGAITHPLRPVRPLERAREIVVQTHLPAASQGMAAGTRQAGTQALGRRLSLGQELVWRQRRSMVGIAHLLVAEVEGMLEEAGNPVQVRQCKLVGRIVSSVRGRPSQVELGWGPEPIATVPPSPQEWIKGMKINSLRRSVRTRGPTSLLSSAVSS